jgi:hypothetical protein
MLGKDHEPHSQTFEAASLFDAAHQAIQQWSRFWWFDPEASLTVQSGEQHWNVTQERVRQWRSKQNRVSQR